MNNKLIFVTGGAGFIGSALIRLLIKDTAYQVVNIDKLTYAGNLESLAEVSKSERYFFAQIDIANQEAIAKLFAQYQPSGVIHLAAESHVDRSINSAAAFMHTNVNGTYTLLECSRQYLNSLPQRKDSFKFIHVSTDEVFGSLGASGYFTEKSNYDPRSPYSATKASSDLLANAWFHTYNLPVIVTNCTNNYGPYHFPEKLIPLTICNALKQMSIPVYGNGNNVRDWLYVDDHVRALLLIYEKGVVGEKYCIGGNNEITNLEVVETICTILDKLQPRANKTSYKDLITFVQDRMGHDYRYAIKADKLKNQLGWQRMETFATGIDKTIAWFLKNQQWLEQVLSKS